MKNRRVQYLAIIVALIVGGAVLSFGSRSSRGQSKKSKDQSPVKPTVRITESSAAAGTKSASPFAVAASQNAILKNELTWSFGGKQQRGWHLYDLLIRETINTPVDSLTAEFAAALGAWQKKAGLSPSGVLDENSLMALVSHWQSKRLKNRSYAEPDQLVMPESDEFYDPSRTAELRQVNRDAYAAYKKMVAAAIADPALKLAHTEPGRLAPTEKYFKIISAFRSREYQEQLRQRSPNAGSAGLAVNSPHFTGRALDIYVGGDPVDTKDSNRAIQVNSPAYQWLVRNAERFGFRPYFYEPWHWEYVK